MGWVGKGWVGFALGLRWACVRSVLGRQTSTTLSAAAAAVEQGSAYSSAS